MRANLYASTGIATALLLGLAMPAFAQDSADEAGARGDAGDIIVTAQRYEQRLQDVPISITVFNQEQLANRNIVTATDLGTYTPSLSVDQRYGPEKSSFVIRGFSPQLGTAPTVGVYFADVVGPRAQGGTVSGNSVGAGAFMDLQNVQVLKGPQGTLFGRNTTGGAILLVPNRPTDRLEGWVEGQIGNYNMKRGMAVLNVPLADTFKVRLAVDRNHREGYMINHSGIGPDDYNDVNYFAARLSILAELTPDLENYTIFSYSNSFGHGYAARYLTCNRSLDVRNLSLPGGILGFLGAGNDRQATAARNAPAACEQLDRQNARGDGYYDVEVNNPDPYISLKQWQVINTTTWKASDNLTIKNIASYAEFRERSHFNLNSDNWTVSAGSFYTQSAAFYATVNATAAAAFGLPAGTNFFPHVNSINTASIGQRYVGTTLAPAGPEDNASQSTFTNELQFQGSMGGDRFIWQAGAYIELSRPLGWSAGFTSTQLSCASSADIFSFNCSNPFGTVNIPGSGAVPVGNISYSATKYSYNNNGLYAQGTFKVTDQIGLTAGIRYTMDRIHGQAESTRLLFTAPNNYVQVCNDPLRFPAVGQENSPTPAPRVVQNRTQCHVEIDNNSNRVTWMANIDYRPTDDLMLYAKYARGYRQGGINFTNVGEETWKPETVDTFEVGAKTSFRGGIRGYFNISGFYNKLRDMQLFYGLEGDSRSGITGGAGIFNAGSARSYGVEVDASVTLFDSLQLDLGYAYLNTKILTANAPVFGVDVGYPFRSVAPRAFPGDPFTLSPKHRLTLAATYTFPLDESAGRLSLGAVYTYTSEQLIDASANSLNSDPLSPRATRLGTIPGTGLLNLNLNWYSVLGSPFDAAAFVTNVTNKAYPVGNMQSMGSNGVDGWQMGQPRMFGFRLRFNFGN